MSASSSFCSSSFHFMSIARCWCGSRIPSICGRISKWIDKKSKTMSTKERFDDEKFFFLCRCFSPKKFARRFVCALTQSDQTQECTFSHLNALQKCVRLFFAHRRARTHCHAANFNYILHCKFRSRFPFVFSLLFFIHFARCTGHEHAFCCSCNRSCNRSCTHIAHFSRFQSRLKLNIAIISRSGRKLKRK